MSNGGTQTDEATVSESYATISAIVIWVILILIAPMWILHSIKTFQDLCTEKRASVSHRNRKPVLNKSTKFIAWLSWFAVTFLVISHVCSVTLYFATRDLHCDMSWIFIFKFQQFSKTCMYWVFIWRLHTIYQSSEYSYPKKCILIFGIVFLIYCVFATLLGWIVVSAEVSTYGGPSYPNWCAPGPDTFQIYGTLTTVQDLIVCIGFLWAFLSPLKKTIRAAQQHGDQKATRKIIYAGTKTLIVTTVALASTVIFIIFAVVTGIGLFGACDYPANVICIILMTPYYPDKIYYQRLCCCCIKCCRKTDKEEDLEKEENDEQRANNLEPTTENTTTVTVTTKSSATTTVDTASALRVAGAKYNDQYVDVNDGNRDVTPDPGNVELEVP